jgi:hypothetical protein
MLSDLKQLLAYRSEREERAAASLRQARDQLRHAVARADDAEIRLQNHHDERKRRQDKLYRQTEKSRLTKREIDDLNIELDLMAETTDALTEAVIQAEKVVEQAQKAVEDAAAIYRQRRHDRERWGHLVSDVEDKERRKADLAEEFQIEDDQGDRRAATLDGPG